MVVGSVIGFVGGAVIGGVIGVVARPEGIDLAEADAALFGAGLVGLVGYGIGTAVGFSVSKWQDVTLDRLRANLMARRGGFDLGLSIEF